MLYFIIFVFTLAGGFFLPWWIAVIIAFIAAIYAGKSTVQSFWSGFAALFSAWVVLALFKSIPNNNMLAARVAALLHLPDWILLLAITALIGGIVGGMGALSGFLVKRIFIK